MINKWGTNRKHGVACLKRPHIIHRKDTCQNTKDKTNTYTNNRNVSKQDKGTE